ncbi:hypothetical protein glysoja_005441 [Glycine soja]|nr:hypothetical protein glysoja_005441 [Glycine soja]
MNMSPFVARVPLICVPNSPSVTIVGDAFRVYATLQIIRPAILSLWAVGPGRLSKATTGRWRSPHMLVYVVAYANGVRTDPIMHPISLAASTALGVFACVFALLLPYPRLASSQVVYVVIAIPRCQLAFMGLVYSKENGFWAGVPVAVSYVSGREAKWALLLVDLMWFGELALKFLQQEFQRCGACEKEDMKMLEGEVGRFKELICSSIKSLAEISSTNFVAKEVEKNNNSCDLEAGKSNGGNNTCMVSGLGEDGIEQTIGSFLQLSRIVVDNLYGDEGEKEMKSQVVLSLSAVGFSLCACIRGTMEIEEAIKELVQWENPSSEIN